MTPLKLHTFADHKHLLHSPRQRPDLSISGAQTKNKMEETAASACENVIHHSDSLCPGEQNCVSERKKRIQKSFSRLGLHCTEDSVPHIALLGSGGGERAVVAMLGSIQQLVKEGLFDTLLYIGGISGSTWAMASLYSGEDFQTGVDQIIATMQGPGVPLDEIVAWLDDRTEETTFSLTDIWAVLISTQIMKQLDLRHLSGDANRSVTNPYPIYSTVERECTSDKPENGHWFEISPHESGLTDMGWFIETAHLGSRFCAGKLVEEKPEMDMVKLQGICGSALADWQTIIHHLFPLREAEFGDIPTQAHLIYVAIDYILNLIKRTTTDPELLAILEKLQEKLKEIIESGHMNLLKTSSLEEGKTVCQENITLLIEELELCCENLQSVNHTKFYFVIYILTAQTEIKPAKVIYPFSAPASLLVWKLLKLLPPLLIKWEWGNTNNFLYCSHDANIPSPLCSEEIFYLIDAGLWMNVPYPPFLGAKRDIDLIVAPDFSAGEVFETLTLAKKYALDKGKPFPEIDDQIKKEKDWPKDCYVFEGKEKEPTIVYMPLFNRANCRDAKELQAKMKKFCTFQRPYNNDMMNELLDIARDNIKRNKTILVQEMEKAIQRRSRRSSK
ncbi:LOW QUALITY PROTEIN: cytosolic phospholipase A2 gamma-like [Takifugu flavidus]|uniref:LOW QUALITY PROTEIN: cytosolic phospholipase A2 gamma-like n=1 Tax=Takifugu flavidus TaxID=433684 RepID=UPI0025446335|nr:LOW QUALITY PROTEIN: cytosolic phospholipase A2 gamma-like [Takifugu flavidus]